MSNTGDGHRASAEALRSGFKHAFPGRFDIEIIDLLVDHLPQPLSQLPKTYASLTNHLPRLWQWMWNMGASQRVINPLAAAASWVVRNDLVQLFADHRPDLVISVHPLIQHIALDALGQHCLRDSADRRIPFVTVVTDLATAHPTWFHPKIDLCFVGSQDARRQAVVCGVDPLSLYEYGVPVRQAFHEPYGSRETLRRDLSLDPILPTAIITGGGEGHGPIAEIAMRMADALAGEHGSRGQLAVICGRNEALRRRSGCAWLACPHTDQRLCVEHGSVDACSELFGHKSRSRNDCRGAGLWLTDGAERIHSRPGRGKCRLRRGWRGRAVFLASR